VAVIALALALAVTLGPPVAPGRGRRCEPFAERCRGSVIYTCTAAGRWRRGIDCARAGRRDRATVCSVEPDGSAVCVEDGGAS
jgi:hypothetical protein